MEIHPQLQADGIHVGRFELCHVLLMNDANYPWLVLVPDRDGISEIYQLSSADQALLLAESSFLAERLMQIFAGDKMNVAALGNVVPQLHIHHIVRYKTDVAWPAPVWGRVAASAYEPQQLQQRLDALRTGLAPHLR